MSMSELHKPEWYGECAIISDKYNDFAEILYLICDYPHKHYTFKHFEV
jgi:hypothetical protein